jgi:alpha-glucosidase (family GH31 glycosyl hydrolase)
MGIGESDSPPAQELLENWPDECAKYDIPCSGMHLSSGYTVGEDGNRYVFGMNKKRYPDFKAMVTKFHQRGIRVVPNIKPCERRNSSSIVYTSTRSDSVFTRRCVELAPGLRKAQGSRRSFP